MRPRTIDGEFSPPSMLRSSRRAIKHRQVPLNHISGVFSNLTPMGTTIGVVRLFRYTVRSAAESLARFGPPGIGVTPCTPGSAWPVLAADPSGAVLGAVLPDGAEGRTVLCAVLAPGIFSVSALTVFRSALSLPEFPGINLWIIHDSVHNHPDSA